MSYSPTYNETEIDDIVVDVGLKIFVVFGTFATLIGLAIVYNIARGRKWNGKVK